MKNVIIPESLELGNLGVYEHLAHHFSGLSSMSEGGSGIYQQVGMRSFWLSPTTYARTVGVAFENY